jgi:hypothetical protein
MTTVQEIFDELFEQEAAAAVEVAERADEAA